MAKLKLNRTEYVPGKTLIAKAKEVYRRLLQTHRERLLKPRQKPMHELFALSDGMSWPGVPCSALSTFSG